MSRLRLAGLFGRGAVLPAEVPLPVWGWAEPGAQVRIRIDDEEPVTSQADVRGAFRCQLPPQAVGGPHRLQLQAGEAALLVEDLLFGDCWLCVGQSNMEWTLSQVLDGTAQRIAACDPAIRYWHPQPDWSPEPADDLCCDWQPAVGRVAGGCSAVAYHFAATVRQQLDRPIGLLQLARGGSLIEAWLPRELAETEPAMRDRAQRIAAARGALAEQGRAQAQAWASWAERVAAADPCEIVPRPPAQPDGWLSCNQIAACDQALVQPLAGLPIRGVLWYQGESNTDAPGAYPRLFRQLVEHWRQHFRQIDLPVYTVQLAGFQGPDDPTDPAPVRDDGLPALRLAQEACCDQEGVHLVTAIDCGDRYDIHPAGKEVVGRRLAGRALRHSYGLPGTGPGPRLLRVMAESTCLELLFREPTPLRTRDGGPVQGIQVRDPSGRWTALPGRIVGDRVVVDLPQGLQPVELAYAGAGYQLVNLTDANDLPAWPARRPVVPRRPGAQERP